MSPVLKKMEISFPPSGSPDVIGYKVFVQEAPDQVTHDSESWDIGNVTRIDLSTLDGMTTKDGTYNLGVCAIDDVGNMSSLSIADNIPLDFAAPDPPGLISFTNS